ncbi:transposase family protein [bacterium]|nr:transposase family protein [bacterium]
MVGLSCNLTVNFVSDAYGGRASDKAITLSSHQFLNAIPPNSSLMADKGFNIAKELKERGVQLIILDFKGRNRSQLTPAEVSHCESVSSARIHVERIIQRIRTFHILDSTLHINQQDITSQVFRVCSYLVNFQMPIVNLRQDIKLGPSGVGNDDEEYESIFDFI